MRAVLLLARKESGELLLGRRGLGWLLALSGVLSAFALLLIGDVELSLLDNAQVVYDMMATIAGLGCLLAVLVGSDAFAGERERGSLVPLLLTPLSRRGVFLGKLGGQLAAWAVMYALSLPYLWAVGSSGQNLVAAILCLALLGTPVVLGFGCFAIGLSARSATARASLLYALIALVLAVSPLLIGPSLRRTAVGRLFDVLNPFSVVVNGFDEVVIDSAAFLTQLPHFALAISWLVVTLWFAHAGLARLGA
jgi:ABC-type transport system involved in multi-copper enzyme maturation permease subunit